MSAGAGCVACSSWPTLPRYAPRSPERRSRLEACRRPACRCSSSAFRCGCCSPTPTASTTWTATEPTTGRGTSSAGAANGDGVELDDAPRAAGRWVPGVPVSKVALFWALTLLLLTSFRSVARAFARNRPWYLQDALVVGPADETEIIVRKIDRHPEWRIRATAHVDLPLDEPLPGRDEYPLDVASLPQGDAQLITLVKTLEVDRVMLAPRVERVAPAGIARLRARRPRRSRRPRPKLVGHRGRSPPASRDGGHAAPHGSAVRDGPLVAAPQARARYRGRRPRARLPRPRPGRVRNRDQAGFAGPGALPAATDRSG